MCNKFFTKSHTTEGRVLLFLCTTMHTVIPEKKVNISTRFLREVPDVHVVRFTCFNNHPGQIRHTTRTWTREFVSRDSILRMFINDRERGVILLQGVSDTDSIKIRIPLLSQVARLSEILYRINYRQVPTFSKHN